MYLKKILNKFQSLEKKIMTKRSGVGIKTLEGLALGLSTSASLLASGAPPEIAVISGVAAGSAFSLTGTVSENMLRGVFQGAVLATALGMVGGTAYEAHATEGKYEQAEGQSGGAVRIDLDNPVVVVHRDHSFG